MLFAKRLLALSVAAVVLLGASANRAPIVTPPSPTSWVTDDAGVLSTELRRSLDRRLAAHERQTGQQVLLWIGRTAGGAEIEDWAARTFDAWKVGRSGLDDGVVIFVLTEDHRMRIEVGYGLDSLLTDAAASRVLRETMLPRVRGGDWNGAARLGVESVLSTLAQAPDADVAVGAAEDPAPPWPLLVGGALALVLALIVLARHPQWAIWLVYALATSGRGAGGHAGGSFGHGFRGGGGRSGGGGASGRW